MDPATERLAELLEEALALPPTERAAFVSRVSTGDDGLRYQLDSLLEAHASSGAFFDELAAEVIAPGYAAVTARESGAVSSALVQELEEALRDRYRIERELGGGAMSRVFLAEETRLGRPVVIKVLPPDLAATMSDERFRREIQLAAQLQHPHIVPLLASDAAGRLLYYTMPFVAGESLRVRMQREGALPLKDALTIWRDVLEALTYAHALRVVHRDIKPANILLSGRSALVTDFGIARAIEAAAESTQATSPGVAIGTPAYMAPEQITSGADAASDLYAAGLVMYEMLEGRLPFGGSTPGEVMAARLTRDPAPLERSDCPPQLASLLMRCLARGPAERPVGAEAVLAELDELPAIGTAPPRRSRPLLLGVITALIVAGAALAALRLFRNASTSGSPAPSIAVLPLTAPDTSSAALAGGMTEELMSGLTRIGTIRVAGSTSVLALQGRRLGLRQIAESLHVSHVLEGSLQRAGERLRVQVRLVDAKDGTTRWSETYDRTAADLFAVQDEIARDVALELDIRLATAGPTGTRRPRATTSVAANEWYLRARGQGLQRSAAGRTQTVEYLQRALAADSTFAAAHAALAWSYLYMAGTMPGDHIDWSRRGEQSARTALALDSLLPEAHSALGWVLTALHDFDAAELELKRGIALDPLVHRGYEGLARLYVQTGQPAAQLAAAQRGLEADPYSVSAIREMALALNMNGRCDSTLALLKPLKELTPPPRVAGVIRGQCLARMEKWPEAIAEFRWAMEGTDARAALAFLGYALARGGDPKEARRILDDLESGRENSHGAFGVAVVYTGFREYDQAFTWLERAMREGSDRVYIWDSLFGDLHRDPRFARIRELAGLRIDSGPPPGAGRPIRP